MIPDKTFKYSVDVSAYGWLRFGFAGQHLTRFGSTIENLFSYLNFSTWHHFDYVKGNVNN